MEWQSKRAETAASPHDSSLHSASPRASTAMSYSRSAVVLLLGVILAVVSGCTIYERTAPETVPPAAEDGISRGDFALPPPPQTKLYDYRHRQLKEISEEQRIEIIIDNFGTQLQQDYEGSTSTSPQKQWPTYPTPVVTPTAYAPDYPFTPYSVTRHHDRSPYRIRIRSSYSPYSCRTVIRHRSRHRHHSLGVGNTLLFGTLGGVIGHQSGHRDEGILIGAGYGLLRDLIDY